MLRSARHEIPPQTFTEETWRHLQGLHWENAATRALRRATGDLLLCAAYDPKRDCWVLARYVKVAVGAGRDIEFKAGRVVWLEWRDEIGNALPISDGRLIPHVLRCARGWEVLEELTSTEKADDAKRRAEQQDTTRYLAKDAVMIRAMARFADSQGLVAHRKGGHEGGRISTAALWDNRPKQKPPQPVAA